MSCPQSSALRAAPCSGDAEAIQGTLKHSPVFTNLDNQASAAGLMCRAVAATQFREQRGVGCHPAGMPGISGHPHARPSQLTPSPGLASALRCPPQVARLARKLPQGDLRQMAVQLGGSAVGGGAAVPVDEAGEEDLT